MAELAGRGHLRPRPHRQQRGRGCRDRIAWLADQRTREQWGVRIVPWRNIREVYGVLRRHEMLGLLVDWGYRRDGIPVRMFGAWTTLPAGPAALAAKTGARIVPIAIRRMPGDRTFHATMAEPIDVPSSAPADLLAATQKLADAVAASIAAAPAQWYSFKPIWPSDPAEGALLEARAAAFDLVASDPTLASASNLALLQEVRRRFADRLDWLFAS